VIEGTGAFNIAYGRWHQPANRACSIFLVLDNTKAHYELHYAPRYDREVRSEALKEKRLNSNLNTYLTVRPKC
jgi:hypothetical protein